MDDRWESEISEYGAINITGFRIVNDNRRYVQEFLDGWKSLDQVTILFGFFFFRFPFSWAVFVCREMQEITAIGHTLNSLVYLYLIKQTSIGAGKESISVSFTAHPKDKLPLNTQYDYCFFSLSLFKLL